MFGSEKINFRIISVLRLILPKSGRYVPKKEYHVLSLRLRGKAELLHCGNVSYIDRDDVTYIPAGYDYTINSHEEEEVMVIHFLLDKCTYDFDIHHSAHNDRLRLLFEQLLQCWHDKPIGAVYKNDSLFLSILETVEIQTHSTTDERESGIWRIVEYMKSRFSDSELSIEELAQRAGYCPSHFRRVFREVMGEAPRQYLTKLRVEYATELLKSGYYSVEEISDLCGFSNRKYFSTAYKQYTGVSPSKMRGNV